MIGAVALLLGWPESGLQVRAGIDPSWILGLHLAGDVGLHLGEDVVFTFGPLGPLTRPINSDAWSLLPGLLVRIAVSAAVAVVVAHQSRRVLGATAGIVATLLLVPVLVGPLGRGADPEVAILLVPVVLLALAGRAPAAWHAPAAVALATVMLLGKVSAGLTTVAMVAVFLGTLAVRAEGRARLVPLAWLLSIPVVSVVVGLVLGFGLGGLPGFLGNSLELTLGFAEGMHDAHPRTVLHLVTFAVPTALVVVATWWRVRGADDPGGRVTELGMALLVAGFVFTRFKYGFTREGPGHLVPAVNALLLLVLVQWPARSSPGADASVGRVRWRGVPVAAGAVALSLVAAFVVLEPAGVVRHRPVGAVADAFNDLRLVVSGSHREATRAAARSDLAETLAIPDEVVPGQGTVHVDPWEISAVWSLDRVPDWAPPPVFQSYSAYTPHLDRLNAEHFLSADAPDWILRRPVMIDGRNPAWDPPRHLLAIVCGWDRVAGEDGAGWSLLRRRTTPRCDALAEPEVRTTMDARLGEWVDLDRPDCGDRPTVLTLDPVEGGVLGRLRTLAWVPPVWSVEATLADGRVVDWRWLPAFAGEPMLLDAPPDLAWALKASSSAIERVRLVRADDVLQGGDDLRLTLGCLP